MKLSEYIAGLQAFLQENGDMDAYYAADDEGNAYQGVGCMGSLFYLPEHEKESWHPELVGGDDKEYIAELKEDGIKFTPVCVVN